MKSVVTIGVFDGVHRGHQHILKQVIQRARLIGARSLVYTFDPHPVKLLVPDACPPMITTQAQRVRLIRKTGIDAIVVQKFTHAFSQKTPEQFFKSVLLKQLRAAELFVGYDFTFGVRRSGTITHMEHFCREAGVRLSVVDRFLWKDTLVSSTHIRQLLSHAKVHPAADLMGRPYFMEGHVVRGRGIGGKSLGVHTANLQTDNDLLLPSGVYMTRTHVGGKCHRSLTNIGTNPTFGSGSLSIESHLLDFKKSILGRMIRIEFLKKLREEIVFASAEDLAQQIQNDIQTAKQYFKEHRS